MMQRVVKTIAGLFLLLFIAAQAGAANLEDKVVEHTFKNGLKLLMVERHSSPTVSAWIRFKVGSVHERSDERGIAHLLEHMLFKGTRTLGTRDYAAEAPLLEKIEETAQRMLAEEAKGSGADKATLASLRAELARLEKQAEQYVIKDEFFDLYARNGGSGYNAFTSRDGTTYLISLPANKLELWAAIESDRMKNPVLREFYTERSVVMEERRRSYDAEPSSKLWETFVAAAYQTHPYGQPTIGWSSDIRQLSRTKAESFLKRYYAPNNAIVAVVGDIRPADTIALVERYFGDIPPGTPVPEVAAQEEQQQGERRVEVLGDAEPELIIGFHKTALGAPDDEVFDLVASVLGQGRTSRLYRSLVLEKQLATQVSVFDAPGNRYPNLFVLYASPRAPHTAAEVEQALLAELERLKKEPVSQQELQQVLNQLEFEEARRMGTNGGLARNLTEYEAIAGSWRYLTTYRAKLTKITPADIQRVARQYFTRENRIVGTLVTKKPGGAQK
ncbi:peptidase M16 domain protein [Trichlorobacter lovleyi SZ]|uniref:Peptidase M16 domain protein n=2 Tax=Trichlorobacter lovleyi TaxID=313985 RepID=B3E2H1_TRIL1|nr:peptidase M16 domain protein [Trichlorobacter lovleyi SZ]